MILPFEVHFIPSACLNSADFAVFPGARQSRQQTDFTQMALQQHLRNPGGSAEIAVNLKRRVGIEQVGIGRAGQQRPDKTVGGFPFLQPCIQVDQPGTAPAGMSAPRSNPLLKGQTAGFQQFRCITFINQISGIQTI
ncbi:hypothetical protein D3C81_1791240 [compost metagenome]